MAKDLTPGIRVDGGKRTDLAKWRARKAAKGNAVLPAPDPAAEMAAREKARKRAVKVAREAARAIKALPPKQQIESQIKDNPEFSRDHAEGRYGNLRKLRTPVNVLESAVSVLASKGAINEAQAETAIHFRKLWERLGGAGARAVDWRKEAVDGGRIPDPINMAQFDAGRQLKDARKVLVEAHGEYAYRLVGYIAGEGRSIHEMTETRRQRDTMTDNFRDYLDVLAVHWGYAGKIHYGHERT